MSGANGASGWPTQLILSGLKMIRFRSAVEGHFHHPHGRPWAEVLDQVHPLMAEVVGKSVLTRSKERSR